MGQSVTLVNCKANDLVATNDKFRVTWRWILGEYGTGSFFDSKRYDLSIQESLPSNALLPASAAHSIPGDVVIVYDVRLLAAWGSGNKSVADVIVACDKLPFLTDVALDVAKIEKIPANATSAELAKGQEDARVQGNTTEAQKRDETLGGLNPFKGLESLSGKLAFGVAAVVIVGAGVVAYSYSRK